MSKFLQEANKHKIIPVVAISNPQHAIELGRVLKENELPVVEIVLRTSNALEAVRTMKQHHPEIYIGVGTVKNEFEAVEAFNAGADFIVSPALNPKTVMKCQELGIEIIAGVNNPSTIEQGLELGLSTFKFFPAEASGGVTMVKALLSPYADICLMPTGGVTPNNIGAYLSIDRVVCCGGTWFISNALMDSGDWDIIGSNICEAVACVSGY